MNFRTNLTGVQLALPLIDPLMRKKQPDTRWLFSLWRENFLGGFEKFLLQNNTLLNDHFYYFFLQTFRRGYESEPPYCVTAFRQSKQ